MKRNLIHTKVNGPARSFFNGVGALLLVFCVAAIFNEGDAKTVLVPAVLGGVCLGIASLIPQKDRFEG